MLFYLLHDDSRIFLQLPLLQPIGLKVVKSESTKNNFAQFK